MRCRNFYLNIFITLLFGSVNIKTVDNKQRTCYTIIEVVFGRSNLGNMIKEKREVAGLSQKKLARACGLSDSEIMKIENGQRKTPSAKNLCNLARALKIPYLELFFAGGYISESEINSETRIFGFDKLNEKDKETVQLFIDFIISRKDTARLSKGGL